MPDDDFRAIYGNDIADKIAALANDPAQDDAARQAERERSEADRVARHRELANQAASALRGDFGPECQASVERVLNGATPLRAPMASLAFCESVVKEAKQRKAAKKRASRGAR